MEVPTILSFSSLQRNVKQFVNIPVPRGGVRHLQGFSPEQGSTALPSEHIVDIPVPHGESLHGFLPGQGSASSSQFPAGAADDASQGFFRSFSHGKKVRSAGQVSAYLPRHVSSWTPAACRQPRGSDEEEKDELLAVPIQLRTPAQWARLWELIGASSQVKRRKRKKRRKRRLPKSSSLSSHRRARLRHPAWHVQGWYCCFYTSHCVPSSCFQAKVLDISAGMEQKDS